MSSFTPAPVKATVTADPPLAITGDPDRRLVLAGAGGRATFQPIGNDLPPIIPTGTALPLAAASPVGMPFHVVGVGGIKVCVGDEGNAPASDGFTGTAGTLLPGRAFDDGSGRVWAAGGQADSGTGALPLTGTGAVAMTDPHAGHQAVKVAQPGFVADGYWASIRAHLLGGLNGNDQPFCVKVQLALGQTKDNDSGAGLAVLCYFGEGNPTGTYMFGVSEVYHDGNPGYASQSRDTVDAPVDRDILIQISCTAAGLFTYHVEGFADSANVDGTWQAANAGNGDILVGIEPRGNFTSEQVAANYVWDFECGSLGSKVWE